MIFETNTYLDGRVVVSNLSWTGEGSQTCTLEIINDSNFAASLFLQNKIADATITIWTVYRNADGSFNTPVLYAIGAADDSELNRDYLRITLVTSRLKTKHFPNNYMGSAGFNHLPAEGTVVFWNSTTYVLERDYG